MPGKINTPLNKILEQVEWGEFKLWELFEINPTKYYKLSNEDIISSDWKVPLVSNQSVNNWVMWFSNLKPNNKWTSITCSDTTIWCDTMFYQEKDFIWYSHIQHFVPKFSWFNKSIAIMIITACKIATSNKQYDYWNKFNREAMNNTIIKLPSKNWNIDFNFITEYITKLEKFSQIKLSKYLGISWLQDYNLKSTELEAIQKFEEWKIIYKKIKLWDYFDIQSTLGFNKDRLTNGNEYDYITRTSLNQWIFQSTWFVNFENLNESWVWSLWLLQMDFFFRRRKWYAGQFIRKIIPKFELSSDMTLFFETILNSQKKVLLSVLVRNVDKKFKEIFVRVPVKDNKLDYEFIETFITAIKKLVIKDVVIYNQERIKATAEIINN